ncbi:hypothetical protein PM022_19125, partial [Halorubrum ezzemoulense]|uniref:hypothetical protein n=1 Tax=Halorubrum ezzemoulense TaxID=337243 RepID=UPI00232C85EE
IIFRYSQNPIFLTKMPVIIGERAAAQIELFFVGFGEDIYMEPTPLTTRHVLRFWSVVKGVFSVYRSQNPWRCNGDRVYR